MSHWREFICQSSTCQQHCKSSLNLCKLGFCHDEFHSKASRESAGNLTNLENIIHSTSFIHYLSNLMNHYFCSNQEKTVHLTQTQHPKRNTRSFFFILLYETNWLFLVSLHICIEQKVQRLLTDKTLIFLSWFFPKHPGWLGIGLSRHVIKSWHLHKG